MENGTIVQTTYRILLFFIITIESVDRGRATYLLQDMCDEDSEKGNLKTTTTTVSSRTGAHRDRYLANFRII